MRIDVPWGTTTVPVEVDHRRVAGVLGADVAAAADPEGVLRTALVRRGSGLNEFLADAPSPLLVVVNDATRPTPTADVLRVLGAYLEGWLRTPGRQLSFAIATGTHRVALPREIEHIFGAEFARAHTERIFSHDAGDKEQLVCVGRTTRSTEIWVNRLLVEAGSVLLINSVEPHYFAGYTGGRKSLFPGLAGYDTVWANHRLSMGAGSETLILAGNPVHEDLEEALAAGIVGKEIYSIQLVLDKGHRVGFAACGHLEDTFGRAVAVAEKQFVLDVERRCEVVVAVACHPMDCNFYQTNKAIQSGAMALKEGGVLIVVSQCSFGLGENPDPLRHAGGGRLARRGDRTGQSGGVPSGGAAGHSGSLHLGAGRNLGGHLAGGRGRARHVHDSLRERAGCGGCRPAQTGSGVTGALLAGGQHHRPPSQRRRLTLAPGSVPERLAYGCLPFL